MPHSKIDDLITDPTKKTQGRYFFQAAIKLGLTIREFEKLPAMESGILKERTVMHITDGKKALLTLGATTSQTSYLGMKIAVNKVATNSFLKKSGIPTTEQIDIHTEKDLAHALEKFGKIILKPANSRGGKGIFSNITSFKKALEIYSQLKKNYPIIIAEKIVEGNEYRVLVINGKVFAVAEYVPPIIIGDGKHSIDFLIKKENTRRTALNDSHLIKINTALRLNLKDKKLTSQSILPIETVMILHKAAPISNGGFTIDATDKIHTKNKLLAEKVATLMNLDIAGIDIITPHIEESIESTGGVILEINGGPDFGVHFDVAQGKSRNGAEMVLKDYFGLV